ncbi:MAG: glycosyltransferase [Candidatus Omnitrophica bacterium]|jgi:glycosyltransferase involved in cell wall biosynthesis|nr:glycosyltransferase [Candidatus Omnitrophota bacterium]
MRGLFISYNGALEPLLYSQGIAYLKKLSDRGKSFSILTFEKKKFLADKQRYRKISAELRAHNIRWYRLVYHKRPAVISTFMDIACGFIYAGYIVVKDKIDIVHARSYVPAVIAFLLRFCLGRKFIFDMRGMMVDEYAEGGIIKKGALLFTLGKTIEARLLKGSSAVVVLTERIKDILLYSGDFPALEAAKIRVIPCCVDTEFFSFSGVKVRPPLLSGLDDRFLFIYTGSVGTWYNLEGMLDFFKTAKKMKTDAHLVILSPGDRSYIELTLKKMGIHSRDFTLGEAELNQIPAFLSFCDAGLIFYKQTFSRLACSPVKFAEYLACGLPVVINSGVGDTEMVLRKNAVGAVISEFKGNCYEKSLSELFELKNNNARLKEECRRLAVRNFSLEKGALLYKAIFDDLCLPAAAGKKQ